MSEKVLSGLKDGIQMPVAWNWDHRFSAALAIVSDEQAQGVITRLRNTMSEVNHAESLDFNGKDLSGLSQHLGNLRGDQQLYVKHIEDDLFAFCTAWPWLSGDNISFRFGVFNLASAEAIEEPARSKFCP
jgi:hypothetical protein